ncbi:helix-turn-helix domain-containing protein [Acidobacteria bacterium AH-259-D05]|nr:helix-turn-helix domain-containing protein [Acidobacteria bacterium AH-259-D05]
MLVAVKEILERLPGLTRYDLEYWEREDFIRPRKVQKRRVTRREYTEEDFDMIRLIWKHHRQGDSPALAYQKALQDLASQRDQESFALHSPRLIGRTTNAEKVTERAKKIRRIILEKSPNLIITVSGAASLCVGAAVTGGTLKSVEISVEISIVTIDRSESPMLIATLQNLSAEDIPLVFHDGSRTVVEALDRIRQIQKTPEIIEVDVNELK